jgi:pyruvate/2-oxoglutarate dehydrogenase complex dihydrolipoamide dehydrogenase (E3) component
MNDRIKADLCVIGAGSAGLSAAAGSAQMGGRVVLVESGLMGGDCLNFGCVPSKSLLAAAHAAQAQRSGEAFGVVAREPEVDFSRVMAHVRSVIRAIEPHDSEERFTRLGVRVIRSRGRFTGKRTLEAGGTEIRARRFLIATGSSPLVPPIPGLEDTPYLTNESVFDLDSLPKHFLIIGGGPIGMELAQAFRRLGSAVTVLEMERCLAADDPDLADIVIRQLQDEGVTLLEKTRAVSVSKGVDGVRVKVDQNGTTHTVTGSHLLVAAGRQPNVADLDLEAAGVEYDRQGVTVDAGMRTSNRRIYAAGDVAGRGQFTHLAGYQAGIVVRRAMLRLPAKADYSALPWCTYTEPELAQAGLTEAAARKRGLDVRTAETQLAENDRGRAEGLESGRLKLVTDRRGRVLGAGIAGPHAGELIQPWILAIQRRLKLKDIAGLILPYPTLGEAGKRAAGEFYAPIIYGDTMKRVVRFLQKLPF